MPTPIYQDERVEVMANADISSLGTSFKQHLNDAITFKINSPNGRMIQFKARYSKWLEGAPQGTYNTEVPEYSASKTSLEWHVDSCTKPDPFYDSGGACERTHTYVLIGDQPDVYPYGAESKALYFDPTLDLNDMPQLEVKEVFVGASLIIINNRVERVVYWKRRGTRAAANYKLMGVEKTTTLDDKWRQILQNDGYTVPNLT